MGEVKSNPRGKREREVSILDQLFWTVQPPAGLIKGEYYREENWFAPHFPADEGYHGILEVVKDDSGIKMVEFNEENSDTYYIKKYQGVSKRLSDYGFLQGTKERTAKSGVVLVNGLTHLEKQMVEENRLTGDFDLLTGASNSINRSMLILAKRIDEKLSTPSEKYYYGLAEKVDVGITGRLQIILKDKKIISCFYDEIFSDRREDIEDVQLKAYYRQSKYHSLDYVSTIGVGFNTFSNLLGEEVVRTQNVFCIESLPFTEVQKNAQEFSNYTRLAEKLRGIIEKKLVEKNEE